MPSKITYCTGLWFVENNQKRSPNHYLKFLPKTCAMLQNQHLILFYEDDKILDRFHSEAKNYNIALKSIKLTVSQLPAFQCAEKFAQICNRIRDRDPVRPQSFNREKGLIHYWREFIDSGEAAYIKIMAIWLSKVLLVSEIAKNKDFLESDYVAWVDASISRFNGKRQNWNFVGISSVLDKIMHYDGQMRNYYGKKLDINASFLLSNSQHWQRLKELYTKKLEESLETNYPHDEETILNLCMQEQPSYFLYINSSIVNNLISTPEAVGSRR